MLLLISHLPSWQFAILPKSLWNYMFFSFQRFHIYWSNEDGFSVGRTSWFCTWEVAGFTFYGEIYFFNLHISYFNLKLRITGGHSSCCLEGRMAEYSGRETRVCWQKGWPAGRSGLEAEFERGSRLLPFVHLASVLPFLCPHCHTKSCGVSSKFLPCSIFDSLLKVPSSLFSFLGLVGKKTRGRISKSDRMHLWRGADSVCHFFPTSNSLFVGRVGAPCLLLPIVICSQIWSWAQLRR